MRMYIAARARRYLKITYISKPNQLDILNILELISLEVLDENLLFWLNLQKLE